MRRKLSTVVVMFMVAMCAALAALLGAGLLAGAAPARAQTLPPRPTLTPVPSATPAPPATPVQPTPVPSATPAPPPTPQPGEGDEGDEGDDGGGAPEPGRITGTVIDLTTGAPAPGLTVTVGELSLTTDANGNYDRGGLAPGAYPIALVLPEGRGEPAQGALTVELAPGGLVVQHLAFRSPPPAVEPAPEVPAALPATGGPGASAGLALAGLLLAALGGALLRLCKLPRSCDP